MLSVSPLRTSIVEFHWLKSVPSVKLLVIFPLVTQFSVLLGSTMRNPAPHDVCGGGCARAGSADKSRAVANRERAEARKRRCISVDFPSPENTDRIRKPRHARAAACSALH